MKRYLFIILLVGFWSCEDKIITTIPNLDYKEEILGNWVFDSDDLCLTFFDDGHARGGYKSDDGVFTYNGTFYYTITENDFLIYSPKDIKNGVSMKFSYLPSKDFSSINIININVEYYDDREPVDSDLENLFFIKRDDLVVQKPFYEKWIEDNK